MDVQAQTNRWIERLQLTVVHDRCALAASTSRPLLAAVYPHLRQIVLFEACISTHTTGWSSSERDYLHHHLVMHEVYHYLCWKRCRRARRRWNPRCAREEAAAQRFAERWCSRAASRSRFG